MRSLVVLPLIVALSTTSLAQSPTARNSLYGEFAGNGLIYSVNYDHLLSDVIGARIGVSYTAPELVSLTTFPVQAYYLIGLGSGSSKLEFGLGVTVFLQREYQSFSFAAAPDDQLKDNNVLGTATVGYRYQRADGGFIFRVGFTPFFGKFSHEKDFGPFGPAAEYEDVFRFVPWGGISFGYGF
jgi:hypothetical protein